MNIHTTARHCDLTQDDRDFARTRMEKFQRFAKDIHEIHLVVTAERYLHVAEFTLRLKQRDVAVREEAPEPRRAIDLAADRVEQQLRRLHDRRVDRAHEARRAPNGPAPPEAELAAGSEPEGEDGESFGDSREA